MKFLVITSRRQQLTLPPDAMVGVLSAQRDWIRDRVDDGTIETIYGFPHGGGVAIVNADDGEDLAARLMSSPAYMTLDWDVRPVGDIDTVLSNAIEAFRAASAHAPV